MMRLWMNEPAASEAEEIARAAKTLLPSDSETEGALVAVPALTALQFARLSRSQCCRYQHGK
jgi:hypothetical protein